MRANVPERMTSVITVIHRPSSEDYWYSQAVEGAWQTRTERQVSSDAQVQSTSWLRVQIPSDQGDVKVRLGDYLVQGSFEFEGTTEELRAALPAGFKRAQTIRDLRGGLRDIAGGITRYASSIVIDAA